jgi:hypothetical protein
MSLLQNSNAISAGGYDLTNSLRFRSSASAFLSRTPITAGNRKTWTWSAWLKRGTLATNDTLWHCYGSATNTTYFLVRYETSGALYIGNASTNFCITTQVFRDPSAWYHLVITLDTTQATATDRLKIYVNGVQVTAFSADNRAAQIALNSDQGINQASVHTIGRENSGTFYLDGYLDEVNFIDGQALTPSSFGETDAVTGSWVAKKYTGTYGINGFYLPFSDTDSNENLSLGSQTIGGSYWFNANVTVTVNNTAAPDGTTTGSRLQATSADSATIVGLTGLSSGQTYTWSVYLKADSTTSIALLADRNGAGSAGYEVLPITVTTSWQRFSITFVAASSTPALLIGGGGYFASPEIIYAWGSQLNNGSIARKYLVTTGTVVTNQGTIENLLTYSEDLTNAAWDKSGNVTATGNTLVAPNGATTADTLFETAVTNEHYLQRTLTPVTNTQYVFSTYVKYLNRKYIGLRIVYSNGANDTLVIFDIQNGTYYGYDGSAPTATSITSVGNGWYRISATFTTPATNPTATLLFRHQFRDDSLMGNYAGNASVGMYIWGSQLETQGTLGPYLSTAASAQSLVHRIGTDRSLGATVFGYNTWIPNNISLTQGTTYDAMIDVPTNTSATVANYAVLNPLKMPAPASVSYTNGNLFVSCGNGNQTPALVTIYPSSGKWYWEVIWTSGSFARVGVQNTNVASTDFAADTAGWRWESNTGNIYNGSTLATVSTYATNDVLGFCLDCDAGKLYVSKNGTWQNSAVPASGTGAVATNIPTSTLMSPAVATGSGTSVFTFNAGQQPFAYTPPTGFKTLNTYNLPDSTIKKGNAVMDATLYTGNGANRSITNASSFRPDFVWGQARSAAYGSWLFDSVRGATKQISSFSTNAESTQATMLTAFNSDGFSMGTDTAGNQSSITYVAWQWQAGSSTVTNTSGTISSQVRANPTAGFSIVTYSGSGANATVGHGLGVAPKMIIVKCRSAAFNWAVYHSNLTSAAFYLSLNQTIAQTNNSTLWNGTAPTSSVFSVGTAGDTNAGNLVAYCWAEIAGFSKFGSYTGNGSTDGPFVYLGFRPKFIMLKNASAANNWVMYDTSRNTFNVMPNILYANLANAEAGGNAIVDALSNGFKLRNTFADHNGSGNTIIYAAFAENPFKNANAR